MSHLPAVVVMFAVEFTSAYSVVQPPLVPPYSSASWWKPWPPSCMPPLGPSLLPPDHSIQTEPVFHQRLLLRTIECQLTVMPAGVLAVSCVCAARVSHVARRLVSSP